MKIMVKFHAGEENEEIHFYSSRAVPVLIRVMHRICFRSDGGGISQSNSIDSLQDLANAVNNASDGDRLTLRNVRINPSSYLLPKMSSSPAP